MAHYVSFLASYVKTDLLPIRNLLTSLCCHSGGSHELEECADKNGRAGFKSSNIIANFCCVDQNFENLCNNQEQVWQELNSLDVDTVLQEKYALFDTFKSSGDQKAAKLWEYLHSIADVLPYAGFTLDVFLINPRINRESCAHTLGALMRLREWHGAQITIVAEASVRQESMIQFMASVLHAEVRSSAQLCAWHWPVWRGIVVWPLETGFVQAGVSLECVGLQYLKEKLHTLHFWKKKAKPNKKDAITEETDCELAFGRSLEVLTCVSLGSVPLYLIDKFSLQLYVKQESQFGHLAKTLTNQEALLLRLPLYEKSSIPVASLFGLSTSAWKEGIAATGRPMPDPEKDSLSCKQHLFILVPGEQETSGPLNAIVLCSPSEVNAELFENLHRAIYFDFQDNSQASEKWSDSPDKVIEKVVKAVHNLPLVTASDFHTTDKLWLESMIECINSEKRKAELNAEEFKLTTGDLLSFVIKGQEIFLEQGVKQEPKVLPNKNTWAHSDFLALTDLLGPASEWPERKALSEGESKAKVLRRYQSDDSCSMMLSSPLGPEEASMDAKDMVKWFKPDGSAVYKDLSPVMAAVRPQRLSSHDEKSLQWPACKDIQYHDIYYGHNRKCEKQEQFFQKFRDTIMLEESHHVCSQNPHVPALRFRGDRHRSQMDVSCGGSKLTPITRTHSSSFQLANTPSMKHRQHQRSGERSQSKELRSGQLSLSDKQFSALKSRGKRERSLNRDNSETDMQRQSLEHLLKESFDSSQPRTSTSTLPPFRRLLATPDTVSIFTPPLTQQHQTVISCDSVLTRQSVVTSPGDESQDRQLHDSIQNNVPAENSMAAPFRESRSQRHKRRLEEIVSQVLLQAGVSVSDIIYSSCFTKLFQVTKFYVTQLPHSYNLKAEMKSIAEKQVQQVVDLERRRQDLAVKKKLRKSSLATEKWSTDKPGKSDPC